MSLICPPCLLLLRNRSEPIPGVAWCFVDLAESSGILGWNNKCGLSLEERKSGKGQWTCGETRVYATMSLQLSASVFWGRSSRLDDQVIWNSREGRCVRCNELLPLGKMTRLLLTTMWWMGNPLLAAWLIYGYWRLLYPWPSVLQLSGDLDYRSLFPTDTAGLVKVSFITAQGFKSGLVHKSCSYAL